MWEAESAKGAIYDTSSANPASPLLPSPVLSRNGSVSGDGSSRLAAYDSVASLSSPKPIAATRRISIVQKTERMRRRSSVRFSLKPDAYVESFSRSLKRSRLSSVFEESDINNSGDVGTDSFITSESVPEQLPQRPARQSSIGCCSTHLRTDHFRDGFM